MLDRLWNSYQDTYLHADGYVLDPERRAATSEGQGYALLRAAWSDDDRTFERVFRWTETHLRRADGLYHWLWSPAEGVLDANTATDGDQEIALALLIAAARFGRDDYRDRASEILRAIRRHAWLDLPGGGLPAAGDWAVDERIVNPSYLLPYAYPLFEAADPDGGWIETREATYALLERIEGDGRFDLPPDFLVLGSDGAISPLPDGHMLSRDFSFDAVRIYWRLAVDCPTPGAAGRCVAGPGFPRLADELGENGTVAVRYGTDGARLSEDESLSFYGALLPALARHAPALADVLRREHLSPDALEALMAAGDRYYDANWVWFGLAADAGLIRERTPTP